ncbi:MAG TPA: polyprenyl diphosphate synthase [Paenalcaligenes sp.]|nr:polyprenyl diphosphate synthase [Paenalcaligenes sp.]
MIPSTTQTIPTTGHVPRHLAIIMDGNGRWATQRYLPRTAGHVRGVQTVRRILQACGKAGVQYLTLFAFSSENWRRPQDEVTLLMRLFMQTLEKEVDKLCKQGVRLRIIGDITAFEPALQKLIKEAEAKTAHNDALHLTVAANYGGRWDILQAMRALVAEQGEHLQDPGLISEEQLSPYLSMSFAPEPDLFIRTGGEQRISNFLIWQLAYTELYFTNTFWPDFNAEHLAQAFEWYRGRERRFGRTSAQMAAAQTE